MKNVHITDKKTGKVVAIPIQIKGANYTPTTAEYEAKARKAAVDDRAVDPKRRADYTFTIEDVPIPGARKS